MITGIKNHAKLLVLAILLTLLPTSVALADDNQAAARNNSPIKSLEGSWQGAW